jgi:hypothetical protein
LGDRLARREAIHTGHRAVHKDNVWLVLLCQRDPFFSACGCLKHVYAKAESQLFDVFPDVWFIVCRPGGLGRFCRCDDRLKVFTINAMNVLKAHAFK